MTPKVFVGYDGSYTYILDADGQAITGFYDSQNPDGVVVGVLKKTLKRAGVEVIDMGDVYEAIKRAWVDENPDDPEAGYFDGDTDYLVKAFAKGYINLEENEMTTYQVTVAGNLRVYATVDVEANSPEEAEKAALDAINNNAVDYSWANSNGKTVTGDVSDLEVMDD